MLCLSVRSTIFFFTATAPTEIYTYLHTLSLHDALPICAIVPAGLDFAVDTSGVVPVIKAGLAALGSHGAIGLVGVPSKADAAPNIRITALMTPGQDRKSKRLNSSH